MGSYVSQRVADTAIKCITSWMLACGKNQIQKFPNSEYGDLQKTRFRDIRDGLSNTIMVGEMSGRLDIYIRGEPDLPYADQEDGAPGQPAWAISSIFWSIAIHERFGSMKPTCRVSTASIHRVSMWHMGDGSVRMLSNETSKVALHAMATRAGGE